MSNEFFQQIRYGVVLLVIGLVSLGPGTQGLGLGLEHLSHDNKCGDRRLIAVMLMPGWSDGVERYSYQLEVRHVQPGSVLQQFTSVHGQREERYSGSVAAVAHLKEPAQETRQSRDSMIVSDWTHAGRDIPMDTLRCAIPQC